jgi:simple sugar transport system ATP-binding protein
MSAIPPALAVDPSRHRTPPPGSRARPVVEAVGVTKRFGTTVALDRVSVRVRPGIHALLGENGAGKSTLMKCLLGHHPPDSGTLLVDDREERIRRPHDAHALGIGMVYQHFTLAPNLTVLENLVLAAGRRRWRIDWRSERAAYQQRLAHMPFAVDLDAPVVSLTAGEKQKVEIVKQLFLERRLLILDEPTSVLTPVEADDVLGRLRDRVAHGDLNVVLITHKLREVLAYADYITVLRGGRHMTTEPRDALDAARLSALMVGDRELAELRDRRVKRGAAPWLEIEDLGAETDRGRPALQGISLGVADGEIVGVAGVSGNGQRELAEILAGQRQARSGQIRVGGRPFHATRTEIKARHVHCLPEDPLRNACVPEMSVADNLAFRRFDEPDYSRGGWWLRRDRLWPRARTLMDRFGVKAASPGVPIATLSGGNVQRAVLARELVDEIQVLVASNPCFGLDVTAVAQVHAQLMEVRNRGAAVLLISEDLDELMELADRIVVLFEGRLVYQATRDEADLTVIGRRMSGG